MDLDPDQWLIAARYATLALVPRLELCTLDACDALAEGEVREAWVDVHGLAVVERHELYRMVVVDHLSRM